LVLLVDTNIFLAGADRRSDRHDVCAELLRSYHHELATTVLVIAESAWLLLDRLGPGSQLQLLRMVVSGRLDVLELTEGDWARWVDLVERYADLRLDVMDASLAKVAKHLGITKVATLNRRDFTVVRPRHAEAFELLA
jgi:uncharacterized protein